MATSRLFTMLTRLPEFRAMSQQDLTKLGWATKERYEILLLYRCLACSLLQTSSDNTVGEGDTVAL